MGVEKKHQDSLGFRRCLQNASVTFRGNPGSYKPLPSTSTLSEHWVCRSWDREHVSWGGPEWAENAGAWRLLEGISLGGCPGVVGTALVETLHPLHSSSRALWKYLMLKDRWKMDLLLKSRGRSVFYLGSESPQAKWGAGGYQCPTLPEEEEEPACGQWAQRQHPVVSSVTEGQV